MLTNKSLLLVAATLVGGSVAVPAAADPTYNANQVIQHFDTQKKTGLTRSLCIGTAAKCRDDPAATVSTNEEGFNLTVTFEFGSARLTDQAQENLEQFAIALKDQRLAAARFVLEGHTDAIGSDGANQRLSEERASSVANYLRSQGVSEQRLETIGYGEEQLKVPQDPDNADNRRVEARMILE